MWRRSILTAGAAIAVIGASLHGAAARAATITMTVSGTVLSGEAQTGVFGPANTNLTGESFSLVYLFDPTSGDQTTTVTQDHLFGGSAYSLPTIGSGTLDLNGNIDNVGIVGAYISDTLLSNDGTTSYISANAEYQSASYPITVDDFVNFFVSSPSATFPTSFASNFSYSPVAGDSSGGAFQVYVVDARGGTANAYGQLEPTSISEVYTVPIPEPATWAMMLIGVGMIGAGMRLARRKNDSALTAA